MIQGEGSGFVRGVSAQDVFNLVLDPVQYTKADTKIRGVTKLAATEDGMIAREDGLFLGRLPGSVITRYRWREPYEIDVTLEHGVPEMMHAWFEIEDRDGGAWMRHVETMTMRKPFGKVWDLVAQSWLARSVETEVAELVRLLESGERGRGIAAN
jgi:hypothetical protein